MKKLNIRSTLNKYYPDCVHNGLNFSAPDTVRFINENIQKLTDGFILNLLNTDESLINSKMVAVSAAFFKGQWKVFIWREVKRVDGGDSKCSTK